MDAILHASRLSGTANVPPSKSAAHRAVLCAALAGGTSRIDNIEYSDDIRATLGAVCQLGARVEQEEHAVVIKGIGSDGFPTVTRPVFCNESGSTLRFLIPLFSLTAQKIRFTGAGRLMDRPQEVYRMLFNRQGLRFEQDSEGITVFGRLRPGGLTLPGDVSSQFISGLLFAAPLLESETTIDVLPPFESRSYVDLTIASLQRFGVKVTQRARKNGGVIYRIAAPQRYLPCDMRVEGDYSQAAFLAVLGVLMGGITVTGLDTVSRQGDRVVLDILKRFGGKYANTAAGLRFSRSLLKGGDIDLADCPDLGPVLIAMGSFCNGTTTIRNAGRLRIKESDRIASMQQELAKMGGRVQAIGDTVNVLGGVLHAPEKPLLGHNDHRIVMALTVAALAAGVPATIHGAEAVRKSWPDFFEVMRSLGARIDLVESE
nr:3-phosphoshikimate 1-carboxyvinyltransferase [uncultured Gemmiger sp.]